LTTQATIWACDTGASVYSADPGTDALTANPQAEQAVDIAARSDGTLRHCKSGDANA